NFRRREQPLKTIAQYFSPTGERGCDQSAKYAVIADVEARLKRRPQADNGGPDLGPRLEGAGSNIEQLFDFRHGGQHDSQAAVSFVRGLRGHALYDFFLQHE